VSAVNALGPSPPSLTSYALATMREGEWLFFRVSPYIPWQTTAQLEAEWTLLKGRPELSSAQAQKSQFAAPPSPLILAFVPKDKEAMSFTHPACHAIKVRTLSMCFNLDVSVCIQVYMQRAQ
jgi:hypothetical protein